MKAIVPYAGRSVWERTARCNPCCKAWLNPQKSVWTIVPEKSVKVDRGKGLAVAGNTACQESGVLKAVARKRRSARGWVSDRRYGRIAERPDIQLNVLLSTNN